MDHPVQEVLLIPFREKLRTYAICFPTAEETEVAQSAQRPEFLTEAEDRLSTTTGAVVR